VYADEVAALCGRGEDLLAAADPGDALFAWLDDFVAHVATKRALARAATEHPDGRRTRLFDEWHAAMHAAAGGLLARAREAGAVPAEVTEADLLALAGGAALAATDAGHARRLVGLMRAGLGTAPDAPG
jgi:hypothetical protein